MALKTIMLRKEIDDKRKAFTEVEEQRATFDAKRAELEKAINEAETDEQRTTVREAVDAFEAETSEADAKADELKNEIERLETELRELEEKANAEKETEPTQVNERKDEKTMLTRDSKEYIHAYAEYIRTGNDTEVKRMTRAIVSENAGEDVTGATNAVIAVPTMVQGYIERAWNENEITKMFKKSYLKGNVKVGFEYNSSKAVGHAEGTEAPDEEDLSIGIASLDPVSIKKWITVTDEVIDLADEEFLKYIYEELTYRITDAVVGGFIEYVEGAPDTSDATHAGIAKVEADTITIGTVASALAKIKGAMKEPAILMNRETWAKFKAVQYAGNYNVDPFEGMAVLISDHVANLGTATSGNVYAIVGDMSAFQCNFPNGEDVRIKYDDLSLAEKDLVKFVGRMYVGMNIVRPFAFAKIQNSERVV